jgi:hypothetical protein
MPQTISQEDLEIKLDRYLRMFHAASGDDKVAAVRKVADELTLHPPCTAAWLALRFAQEIRLVNYEYSEEFGTRLAENARYGGG